MNTENWTELRADLEQRILNGEQYSQTFADLYYGVEAELESCHLYLTEDEIERIARVFFEKVLHEIKTRDDN
jgi:hypothetical protein